MQPKFEAERRTSPNFPYSADLKRSDVKRRIQRAIKQSDRYRTMKADGASDEEIDKAFHTKVPMTVFTYHGDVDMVMTPIDSILYYKILASGFGVNGSHDRSGESLCGWS